MNKNPGVSTSGFFILKISFLTHTAFGKICKNNLKNVLQFQILTIVLHSKRNN